MNLVKQWAPPFLALVAVIVFTGLLNDAACGEDIRRVDACNATCADLGMEGVYLFGDAVCECTKPLPPKCERGKRERCRP